MVMAWMKSFDEDSGGLSFLYNDNDDDDKREHGKKSAAQACTINGSPPKTPSHNTAAVSGATEDRDGNLADLCTARSPATGRPRPIHTN
jgi:hypothetical protein